MQENDVGTLKYIIVDKITGDISQTMEWGDKRPFPENWFLKNNEVVITVDKLEDIQLEDIYNSKLDEFYIMEPPENPGAPPKTEIEILQNQINELKDTLSNMTKQSRS